MVTTTAVFSVLLIFQTAFAENAPFVRIPQGDLKGKYFTTRNGRGIAGFLGIPYAAPPVGKLRFKDPAPAEGWSNTRDATKYGNPCPQKLLQVPGEIIIGSEDCLFLDVFTPEVSSDSYFPVMVWIHGGGWFLGSSDAFLSPEYLMDKDIVLVAINYRLGALGFLSTEDDVAPGNYGMKDQTAALRWVRDNIKYFGGNPDSVTIFGESAGGVSVGLHILSPLSKGLFHAAISQSGTGHCPIATVAPGLYKKYSKMVADAVGCPYDSSKSLITCLQTIPANKFTEFAFEFSEFGLKTTEMFRPRVEGRNKDAFLPDYPSNLISSVPWMVGLTQEDGVLRVSMLTNDGIGMKKGLETVNKNFERVMEMTLVLEGKVERLKDAIKKIKHFYIGNKEINEDAVKDLINIYTDQLFFYGTTKSIRLHKGSSYFFLYAFKGQNSLAKDFGNTQYNDFGVSHGDEMQYLFPLQNFIPNRTELTAEELKFSQQMVDLWTNFAKYRTPTPKPSFALWEPVTSPDLEYLYMSNDGFEMRKNLWKEREDFWRSLNIKEDLHVTETSKNKHTKTEL